MCGGGLTVTAVRKFCVTNIVKRQKNASTYCVDFVKWRFDSAKIRVTKVSLKISWTGRGVGLGVNHDKEDVKGIGGAGWKASKQMDKA